MKTEAAQQLSDQLNDIVGRLNESIKLVQLNCDEAEFAAYRKVVGRVMGNLILEVINPLYEKNPEVKPENYD